MAIPVIRTARLVLRGQRAEDFGPYADYYGSGRAVYEDGPFDRERAWKEFAAAAGLWQVRGYGPFSVEDRASGAYVGEVGIFHHVHYPEPELGWMVVQAMEGRGLAQEAARAARDWAGRVCGLTRLVSYIDPRNARSIRLAERLGARRDPQAPGSAIDDLVFRHTAPDGAPEVP